MTDEEVNALRNHYIPLFKTWRDGKALIGAMNGLALGGAEIV
jgi:hypothetical protein